MASLEYNLERMNGMAINLIEQGDLVGASNAFRFVLRSAHAKCQNQEESCSSGRYHVSVIRLAPLENQDDHYCNDFDVFPGVFTVGRPPVHPSKAFPSSSPMDKIEALVLLYNFAFSLHRLGISRRMYGCSHWDHNLAKALKVYDLALQCACGVPLEEHPELSTLMLALTANMGQIHSHFFHTNEVILARNQMERLLYCNTTRGNSNMEFQDLMFFEQAMFTSTFANTKLPPAA